MRKRYISHLSFCNGVILVGHTEKGRAKILTDLRYRILFFVRDLRDELRVYDKQFRFISSVRAAAVKAFTFDKKLRQLHAASSGHTHNVGNPGDKGDSPPSGETSTLCVLPQSGHCKVDSSHDSDRHSFSI